MAVVAQDQPELLRGDSLLAKFLRFVTPASPQEFVQGAGIPAVSTPASKSLRVLKVIGEQFLRPGTAGKYVEGTGSRIGGRIAGRMILAPRERAVELFQKQAEHAPATARRIAESAPVHEIGHGLVDKYFPFIHQVPTNLRGVHQWGEEGRRKMVSELLASMLQSLRTGHLKGTLGTFVRNAAILEGKEQLVGSARAWYDNALKNPLNAMRGLLEQTTMSPAQKNAILNSPFWKQYNLRMRQ